MMRRVLGRSSVLFIELAQQLNDREILERKSGSYFPVINLPVFSLSHQLVNVRRFDRASLPSGLSRWEAICNCERNSAMKP